MTVRAGGADIGVQLLERYCSGTSSPEEMAQIGAWFDRHPDQRLRWELLRGELRGESFSPMSEGERQATWTEIIRVALQRCPESESQLMSVARLQGGTAIPIHARQLQRSAQRGDTRARGHQRVGERGEYPYVRMAYRKVWYPIIGIVLGALLIVAGWKFAGAGMGGRAGEGTTRVFTTYATAPGQRATITLPDGNTVALNVASRLDVPVDYGAGNHVVRLPVGEALFTVSHRSGAPFTVVSGAAVTRVLGTSFVVRRYPGDASVTIAVENGKVAVGKTVVTERRMIEVGANGAVSEGSVNPERFAFATGVLTLDSMQLSKAIPELDRWYNADIRLGDGALASQLVEGRFVAGSIADLEELLRLTFDVRVVRDGRVLTIYPRAGR